MQKQKGFTLIEMLFVVLVIALIISFAVPALRSVRSEIKNHRAKTALKKLVQARRNYYQLSKGADFAVGESFVGTNARTLAQETCTSFSSSGVPGANQTPLTGAQIFACGFLDWRDFEGLPYTFYVCSLDTPGEVPCQIPNEETKAPYVGAVGTAAAGAKYQSANYYMYIPSSMQVEEWEAE